MVGGDHLQYVDLCLCDHIVTWRGAARTPNLRTSHLTLHPTHTFTDVLVFIMLSPFMYYGWRIGAPLVQLLLDGK